MFRNVRFIFHLCVNGIQEKLAPSVCNHAVYAPREGLKQLLMPLYDDDDDSSLRLRRHVMSIGCHLCC